MILSAETLIITNNGIKRAENLGASDLIFTGSSYSSFSTETRNEEIAIITTEHGYSLAGEFKLSVSDNFEIHSVYINELSVGDFVIASFNNEFTKIEIYDDLKTLEIPKKYKTDTRYNRYKKLKLPLTIDKNLSYLLGYSYGDGYAELSRKPTTSVVG